jgi:hypothetical protein
MGCGGWWRLSFGTKNTRIIPYKKSDNIVANIILDKTEVRSKGIADKYTRLAHSITDSVHTYTTWWLPWVMSRPPNLSPPSTLQLLTITLVAGITDWAYAATIPSRWLLNFSYTAHYERNHEIFASPKQHSPQKRDPKIFLPSRPIRETMKFFRVQHHIHLMRHTEKFFKIFLSSTPHLMRKWRTPEFSKSRTSSCEIETEIFPSRSPHTMRVY